MSLCGRVYIVGVCLVSLIAMAAITACSHPRELAKEAEIRKTFASCKTALVKGQTGPTLACLPRKVNVYLNHLKSGYQKASSPEATEDDCPAVDLFLRTALARKMPEEMRSRLSLDLLLQRIFDRRLIDPRDIQQVDLGDVKVSGERATAELYYQGALTAVRLPFIQEDGGWKIDVMALRPYAELLMRLDRTLSGNNEEQQVELLVSGLPSL